MAEKIIDQITQEVVDKAIAMAGTIAAKIGIDSHLIDVEQVAVDTLHDAGASYAAEGAATFDTYLYKCVSNAIKSELTKINALKRGNGERAISLSEPIYGKDGGEMGTLGDITPSGQDVEAEVLNRIAATETTTPASRYIASLNKQQKRIAALLLDGTTNKDIMSALGMTKRGLNRELEAMRSYERYRLLTSEL